ncbi:hypothetical protein CRE_07063 [Caenorhabditis remanei]|uniref:Uncharacterized protein n=1 Tax=Caenorhabditis remanei TaxID=31234 RepID=E3NIH5_CAERE|nr:hypothetical protein CRE_07063 [Caenorhabditis remanei]
MPLGLSYPGLRCVLEHLDAVKRQVTFKTFKMYLTFFRIRITSRSAVLQQSEKTIPLRLNYLQIYKSVTSLDDFSFDLSAFNEELQFSCDDRKNNMETEYTTKLGYPNFTELDAKHCNFEYYLPIIDPISFPLKYLRCKLAGLHTYNHPVFRSAESLAFNIFEEQSEAEMICLHKLPCKTISFDHYSLDMIDMVSMIRYWMRNPKEIDTKYTFVEFDSKLVYSELIHLKREFEEIRHDLEGTTVKGDNYPRFLISLTPTSKLHVYAIDNNEPHLSNFIIKVIPESGAELPGTYGRSIVI